MIDALNALGEELRRRGVAAKLYIVGGAVMVLANYSRDATMDVDGDFYPRDSAMDAAREIARYVSFPTTGSTLRPMVSFPSSSLQIGSPSFASAHSRS